MTLREGWLCSTCGQVWAPWFPGPCSHVATTTTNTVQLDHACQPKDKSGQTDVTKECAICGRMMTELGRPLSG